MYVPKRDRRQPSGCAASHRTASSSAISSCAASWFIRTRVSQTQSIRSCPCSGTATIRRLNADVPRGSRDRTSLQGKPTFVRKVVHRTPQRSASRRATSVSAPSDQTTMNAARAGRSSAIGGNLWMRMPTMRMATRFVLLTIKITTIETRNRKDGGQTSEPRIAGGGVPPGLPRHHPLRGALSDLAGEASDWVVRGRVALEEDSSDTG
jgi:hypothetical protein